MNLDILTELAEKAMKERGLNPSIPAAALQQADHLLQPASTTDKKDLRKLLWISIDPEEAQDLDQITYAEALEEGKIRAYVAIADVSALVAKDSPIDLYAAENTTTVYTPTKIFPMLPQKLSYNFTSFKEEEDRAAIIVSFVVSKEGSIIDHEIYTAVVRNHFKLSYNRVAEWLNRSAVPPKEIDAQIRLQDRCAQKMRRFRHNYGALTFETTEAQAQIVGNQIVELKEKSKNRAELLIEDFMIAANSVTTDFLVKKKFPALRRIVRKPKNWPRIVALAKNYHAKLPKNPSAKSLENFLLARKKENPADYPDLCLSVIKLLGRGEYAVTLPDQKPIGHFSLALRDYSHATAPNRRFADLITQRMVKAAFANEENPYSVRDLLFLAPRCTQKQDDAEKIERRLKKSAAALILSSKIGDHFPAIVTGSNPEATWVRIHRPPVEGRLLDGHKGLQVGDRLKVKLVNANVAEGHIDFITDHYT